MNKKHQIEASVVGLTLVSEVPLNKNGLEDFNYKLYRFNDCLHEQHLQPTHVRRNHIKCNQCFEDRIVTLAKERGLTVLDQCKNPLFRVVKRDVCGHVSEVRHSNLVTRVEATRELDFTCEQCYENRLKEEADAADMTYLGAALSKGGVFRHYKFNKCGHTRDINASCVGRGNFVCSDCKEDRYKEEARNAGLLYLGFSSKSSDCKRLYQLPCGHNKEIRMDHARDRSYLCDTCVDSYYTKPSGIYLLKIKSIDGFIWLKLGFSKSLDIRKSNYGLGKDCTITVIRIVDVPTGSAAVKVEKSWHKLLKPLRLDKNLMKKYHKSSGFTECYSLVAEDQILLLMSNLEKEIKNV